MNHYKTTITGLILGGLMAAEPIVTLAGYVAFGGSIAASVAQHAKEEE